MPAFMGQFFQLSPVAGPFRVPALKIQHASFQEAAQDGNPVWKL
jgi:hypothetical protein